MELKYLFLVCFVVLISQSCEAGTANVVKITDQNWADILEGNWLIKFYAPWCPACKAIAPIWKEVSEWSQELETTVAEVDVTEEPGLSGRFLVTSLPTIYHVTNGVFRRYMGPRSKDELISMIEEKKYEEIEPVSWWESPNSIPMSIMSWVFKMSMIVRVAHTVMTEDYGIPVWSSYGFFAVVTIFIGLLLGVILVMIADCFWPVKGRPPKKAPTSRTLRSQQAAAPAGGNKGEKKEDEGEKEEGDEEEDTAASENEGVRRRKTEKSLDESQSEQAS